MLLPDLGIKREVCEGIVCLTEVVETSNSFSFASSGIGSDGPVIVIIVDRTEVSVFGVQPEKCTIEELLLCKKGSPMM